MPLHWSNDPLLLDKDPTPYNDWLTANKIISKQGLETILTKDLSFKNLYGILIRKNDFVRKKSSDRIIARFPFLVLDEEMKETIKLKILLISETTRDYFYRSINKSIMQWKEIIENYLEKGALPYPIIRCSFEHLPNIRRHYNKHLHLRMRSARGERFSFPTKMSRKLAYLCGICNGDGNLRDYWIIVADETKQHIEFITDLLQEIFSKKGTLMKTGGAWIVKLNLLWAVRLFNFLTNQAIDEPKYDTLREPVVFQKLGAPYRNLYWRGAFDADGSFKNQIVFCSISEEYTKDFQQYFTENDIETHFFVKKGGGYQANALAKDKLRIADILGSSHPKKQKDFLNYLNKSYQNYEFVGFNKERLTKDGYFDFQYLPTMSVIGLSDYFKQLSSKNCIYTSKELSLYSVGNGITIKKLVKHLEEIDEELMPFLATYLGKLTFRSASSNILKLPLMPTLELETLSKCLIPTSFGATFYNPALKSYNILVDLYGIETREESLNNKLLLKFLREFCIYRKYAISRKIYLRKWIETLSEK